MSNIDKIDAQIAALKERKKKALVKEKTQTRKKETRRKILVGALVLKHMDYDSVLRQTVEGLLNKNLIKPNDRILFDLEDSIVDDSTSNHFDSSPTSSLTSTQLGEN